MRILCIVRKTRNTRAVVNCLVFSVPCTFYAMHWNWTQTLTGLCSYVCMCALGTLSRDHVVTVNEKKGAKWEFLIEKKTNAMDKTRIPKVEDTLLHSHTNKRWQLYQYHNKNSHVEQQINDIFAFFVLVVSHLLQINIYFFTRFE